MAEVRLLLAVVAVLRVAGAVIDPRCNFGATVDSIGEMEPFGDLCFHFVSREESWFDARKYCYDHGYHGNFVAIYNTETLEFIRKVLRNSYAWANVNDIWIGASDAKQKDVYEWTTGYRVHVNEWAPGEPDGGSQDCVKITRSSGWHFVDSRCSEQNDFICTYKQIPVPTEPTDAPPVTTAGIKCLFEDIQWEIGRVWSTDPCKLRCMCHANGAVQCEREDCSLIDTNKCRMIEAAGTCCGICEPISTTTVPPTAGPHQCAHEGKLYPVGSVDSPNPCLERCECKEGMYSVSCTNIQCPPHDSACTYIPVRGECCDLCIKTTTTTTISTTTPTTTSTWRSTLDKIVQRDTTTQAHVCQYNDLYYHVGRVPPADPCHSDCFCRQGFTNVICSSFTCGDKPENCIVKSFPNECCPRCDFEATTTTATTTTTSVSTTLKMCLYRGSLYPEGDFTPPDPCLENCYCFPDGFPQCNQRICYKLPPSCTPITRAGQCCPDCHIPSTQPPQTQPPPHYCKVNDQLFVEGPVPSSDPCTTCECYKGVDEPLCSGQVCAELREECVPVAVEGRCCPICHIPTTSRTTSKTTTTTTSSTLPPKHQCYHNGRPYGVGWVNSTHPCEYNCYCAPGEPYVKCTHQTCPDLLCEQIRDPSRCCPLCVDDATGDEQVATTTEEPVREVKVTKYFLGLSFDDGIGLLIGLILLALVIFFLVLAILLRRRRKQKGEAASSQTAHGQGTDNQYYNSSYVTSAPHQSSITTDLSTESVTYAVPRDTRTTDDIALQKYRNALARGSVNSGNSLGGGPSTSTMPTPTYTAGYGASEPGYADLDDVRSQASGVSTSSRRGNRGYTNGAVAVGPAGVRDARNEAAAGAYTSTLETKTTGASNEYAKLGKVKSKKRSSTHGDRQSSRRSESGGRRSRHGSESSNSSVKGGVQYKMFDEM